jgi:integrase
MKDKLTIKSVKNIKPGDKRIIVYDTILPSLALFVTPISIKANGEIRGGHKSFYYIYRVDSKTKRQLCLGSFPEITPKQAREIINQKRQNQIPNTKKQPINHQYMVTNLKSVNFYLDIFFKTYVEKYLKPNTIKCYNSLRKNYLTPFIGQLTLDGVAFEDIQKIHDQLKDKPTTANRVLALCSKFFSWCETKDYIPRGSWSIKGLMRYKEASINRFLSIEQMQLIWDSILDLEKNGQLNLLPAAAIKILILTGARKNEILSLKWLDIEIENNKAILNDSKTGFKNIYLPSPAIEILKALPKDSIYVFPSRSKSGHLFDLSWQWNKVLRHAKLEGRWRIHDLRHGFASAGINCGGSLSMVGFLLGHKRNSTTERYAHVAENPAQELLETVARKITGN